jgi:hypothetical protein
MFELLLLAEDYVEIDGELALFVPEVARIVLG